MARHESDREDLFAELRSCPSKWELAIDADHTDPDGAGTVGAGLVVAGFRDDERLSIFFGPDPVFHFDAQGRLRRAYVGGALLRTQGSTLARLERKRSPDETVLHRHDLTTSELNELLESVRDHLSGLRTALASGRVTMLREQSAQGITRKALQTGIEQVLETGPQLAPAIPTRAS